MDIVWSVVVEHRQPYGHSSMFGLGEGVTVNEPGSIFNSFIQTYLDFQSPDICITGLGDVLGFTTPLSYTHHKVTQR